MELPVIFEDEHIVAVNKPAGIMTHPDGRSTEETVSDWFSVKYPNSREVGEVQKLPDGSELKRPGIVHRLDKETSGVLVLAKTPEAHAFLKEAFQTHNVTKTYIAFVYGVPKVKKGIIDFSIGRSRKDFRLRSAQPKAKGTLREAITSYEVIGQNESATHALLRVSPKTGRTHQIRVHLKALHHPVVGDALYAPNRPDDLSLGRLGLHALSLEVPLLSGERRVLSAPLPEELRQAALRFAGGEAVC